MHAPLPPRAAREGRKRETAAALFADSRLAQADEADNRRIVDVNDKGGAHVHGAGNDHDQVNDQVTLQS